MLICPLTSWFPKILYTLIFRFLPFLVTYKLHSLHAFDTISRTPDIFPGFLEIWISWFLWIFLNLVFVIFCFFDLDLLKLLFSVFWTSWYLDFRISWFPDLLISWYLDFLISEFPDISISWSLNFLISRFNDLWISGMISGMWMFWSPNFLVSGISYIEISCNPRISFLLSWFLHLNPVSRHFL